MNLEPFPCLRSLAQISGIEPVRLITPRPVAEKADPVPVSGYTPQQYFDALPGTNAEDSESSSAAFMNPLEAEVGQDYVVETKPSMEERLGEYYLRPSIGVQFPRDQEFKTGTGVNYFLESSAGMLWVCMLVEGSTTSTSVWRFGYYYNELSGAGNTPPPIVSNLDVQNELISFVGTLGYSAAMTEKLTFDFGLGLGFGSRFNSGNLELLIPPLPPSVNSISTKEKTVFSYEFSLLLDYAYTENLSVFAGYRLMGVFLPTMRSKE